MPWTPAAPCRTTGCAELRPCPLHPDPKPWAGSKQRRHQLGATLTPSSLASTSIDRSSPLRCCLDAVAGFGVDWAEVVVGVGSSFGEGDDVVDLVGEGLVADVADAAVSAEDAGRLGRYTFKEQLTGLAHYVWKEGRPMWLPKGRRMWSKSPRLGVYAWPSKRRGARTLDGGGATISSIVGAAIGPPMRPMFLSEGPRGQGRLRGPPEQLCLSV